MLKECYTEQIRINLSTLANKILKQDIIIFGASSNLTINGFINKILFLYMHNSCEDYNLGFDLYDIKNDKSKIYRFNSSTMDEYNASLDIINSQYSYFNSPSAFFKAILESYVRLSFIQRESIILKEVISTIKVAINSKKILRIKTYKHTLEIIPFIIVSAKEAAFSYLVGFTIKENNMKSIRISHIIHVKAYGKASLPKKQIIDNALELLAEYGPTFVEEPITKIKIQFLTENAKLNYEYSLIHRPIHSQIINQEKRIYEFRCSLKQAEYFFFRFAGDIKIIEPIELKERFIEKYQKGINSLK